MAFSRQRQEAENRFSKVVEEALKDLKSLPGTALKPLLCYHGQTTANPWQPYEPTNHALTAYDLLFLLWSKTYPLYACYS